MTEEVKELRQIHSRHKQNMWVVKIKTVDGKLNVLKAKSDKLKGTETYITSDSTYNERETQRHIGEGACKMRESGMNVQVKHLRIESDGKVISTSPTG